VRLQSVGSAPGETASHASQITTGANSRVTISVPPGGYVLLARADAAASERAPATSLPTTQTTEFADDLDTARLGTPWREVPVTLAAGSS
jgi:hypothetical protein